MPDAITIQLVQSPLIRRGPGDGRNLCYLNIDTPSDLASVSIAVHVAGRLVRLEIPFVGQGSSTVSLFLPLLDARAPAEVSLSARRAGGPQAPGEEAVGASSTAWIEIPRRWDVHLVPYSHHDYGYTDLPSAVFVQHRDYLDRAIRLCRDTERLDERAQYRYSIEESSSLESWLACGTETSRKELASLVASGRIEVTALYVNAMTSLCSTEVMIRHLYPAAAAAATLQARVSVAVQNDVPGLPWGLMSMLVDVGVDALAFGTPSWYFSGRRSANGEQWGAQPWIWDEERVLQRDQPGELEWEGPDGRTVRVYRNLHGGDEELYVWSLLQLEADLSRKLGATTRRSTGVEVACFTIRGAIADNAPPADRVSEIVREWNETWESPQLRVSTHRRFLDAIPATPDAPRVRGELPHTDYVIGALSAARETAINRCSHETAVAAEGIALMATLFSGREYPGPALARGFKDMLLFDSHCYGFYRTWGAAMEANWAEKACFAFRAAAELEDIIVKSLAAIGDSVAPGGPGLYLVVANTSGVAHAQPVRLPLAKPASIHSVFTPETSGAGASQRMVLATAAAPGVAAVPPEWLDGGVVVSRAADGAVRPSQLQEVLGAWDTEPCAPERTVAGRLDRRASLDLVFDPGELPAFGVSVFQVQRAPDGRDTRVDVTPVRLPRPARLLENDFYRIAFDDRTGTIRSIVDKDLLAELVDSDADAGFGSLVSRSSPSGEIRFHHAGEWSLSQSGPVFDRALARASFDGECTATLSVTLYRTTKRIDFDLRLPGGLPSLASLHAAFRFRAPGARLRFEGTGAVVNPETDCIDGAPRNYFAVQRWVEVADEDKRVILVCRDSPVVSFGGLNADGVSLAHRAIPASSDGRPLPGEDRSSAGHCYVYLTDNNFGTNFRNAQGPLVSRFCVTSGAPGDSTVASSFGAAAMAAGGAQLVSRTAGPIGPRVGLPWRLFAFEAKNVTLTAAKRSEDGRAVILRFWETAGEEAEFLLSFDRFVVDSAEERDAVERLRPPSPAGREPRVKAAGAGSVHVRVPARGITTVRLTLSRRLAEGTP